MECLESARGPTNKPVLTEFESYPSSFHRNLPFQSVVTSNLCKRAPPGKVKGNGYHDYCD